MIACSRSTNSRPRYSDGRVSYIVSGKNDGEKRREDWGESEGVLPFSLPSLSSFFFLVNFSPALYYLNAWNRLRRSQKTIVFMRTGLHSARHASSFLEHFFGDHCTTTTWNLLMRRTNEDKFETNFPFSFWNWIKSLRVQLHEKAPAFDKLSGSKQTR